MSIIVRPADKKNDGRANGLQEALELQRMAEQRQQQPPLQSSESFVNEIKQEAVNATNPQYAPASPEGHLRSKWTDVNRANPQMQPQQQPQQQQLQQQQPVQAQQWVNQNAQDAMWQEMQRRDKVRLQQQQQQQQNYPLLQYGTPTPSQKPNQGTGQVTNGLHDGSDRKTFAPFNVKNSAMLTNAGNVNLQQSSMANGLLQNQQRNQQALDNSWNGQAPPQPGQLGQPMPMQVTMDGFGSGEGQAPGIPQHMQPNMQQGQLPGVQPQPAMQQPNAMGQIPTVMPQQCYEIIGSPDPGKPPQYVLRNAQDMYQGFPPQRPMGGSGMGAMGPGMGAMGSGMGAMGAGMGTAMGAGMGRYCSMHLNPPPMQPNMMGQGMMPPQMPGMGGMSGIGMNPMMRPPIMGMQQTMAPQMAPNMHANHSYQPTNPGMSGQAGNAPYGNN